MTAALRPAFYFDLSELFFASSARLPYYGIARTVREVCLALEDLNADVGFVVFSPSHKRFFQVYRGKGAGGSLDFPRLARPMLVRPAGPDAAAVERGLRGLSRGVVNGVNRARWVLSETQHWRPVDLTGQPLVSFARVKLLSTFVQDSDARMRLYPMIHDLIPLHDLTPTRAPKFAKSFLHDTQVIVRHAERLIANSDFTRQEIAQFARDGFFGGDCPPVSTLRLAHELRCAATEFNAAPAEEGYFLCVGTQTGRKNFDVVLQALLVLHETGRPVPTLVLAGARRKRTLSILSDPKFAPIRDRVTFRINPSDAHLAALYAHATALIIPSKMEGWGLPLGEALWMGTPAIAAQTPALREVGGDLATYFDPDDAAALADIMQHFTRTTCRATAAERLVGARPNLRTWRDVARDLTQILGA